MKEVSCMVGEKEEPFVDLCLEWLGCIRTGNPAQMTNLQSRARGLLSAERNVDDAVISLYLLNSHLHSEQLKGNGNTPDFIKLVNITYFLSHFISGRIKQSKADSNGALRNYLKAEHVLSFIEDSCEKAKFYEAVAAAYKNLQEEIAANAYLKKHKEEAAKCMVVM